jgi:hypothetical protein
MRPVRNKSNLASALIILLICASSAPCAEPADVMVHGAGRSSGANATNPVWIVQYIDSKDPKDAGSIVYFREKIGDDKWQQFEKIAFRVVEITSHASELVVVKDNRTSWAWFSSRFTYGPELPDHQKILAIAGDKKNLWAIGSPTSRSAATTRSTATTRPSLPILHQLIGDTWTAQDVPWPAGISFDTPEQVSMTIINENPIVAINTGDRFIQLLQYSRTSRRWEKMKAIESTPKPPRWFKLLNFADQPAVWVWAEGDAGLGQIWTINRPITLPDVSGIDVGDADVTIAGDTIWLVYHNNQGKLLQQRFNSDGSKVDDTAKEVSWNKPQGANNHGDWITIGVMTMLTFLILSALLRRRAAANKDAGDDNESDESS